MRRLRDSRPCRGAQRIEEICGQHHGRGRLVGIRGPAREWLCESTDRLGRHAGWLGGGVSRIEHVAGGTAAAAFETGLRRARRPVAGARCNRVRAEQPPKQDHAPGSTRCRPGRRVRADDVPARECRRNVALDDVRDGGGRSCVVRSEVRGRPAGRGVSGSVAFDRGRRLGGGRSRAAHRLAADPRRSRVA